MAEAALPSIDLVKLVGLALQTPELAPVFYDSNLTHQEIVEQIRPRLPDILSVAQESLSMLRSAEEAKKAFEEERDHQLNELDERKSKGKGWVIFGFLPLCAAAVAWLVQGLLARTVTGYPVPSSRFALVVDAASALVLIGFGLQYRSRITRQYQAARAAVQNDPQHEKLEQQLQALRPQFEQTVYERGILSEVRGILSQATAPSYATQLPPDVTDKGLSETTTGGNEVETKAKRDLDELLKLPGGSVGLAGPRGAGKTTLINLIANRPIGVPPKPVCSVQCSAPVEYNGRDYLVTLFLLLCQWVQHDLKPESSARFFRSPARDDRPTPIWASTLEAFLGRSGPFLAIAGVFLVGVALLSAFVMTPVSKSETAASPSSSTHAVADKQATETAAVQSLPGQAAAGAQGSAKSSSVKNELPDNQTRSQRISHWIGEYLKSLGVQPMTLLEWGLFLLAVAWTVAYFQPALALHTHPELELDNRYGWSRILGLGRRLHLKKEPQYRRTRLTSTQETLLDIAIGHLGSLRFQQSYTSGWSGALKLPFGVEGGINDAQTMSRNQRSLPELVQDFRQFLQLVTAEYGRVIIGVDELDKLQSDDKAHLFLNEIKAIFGVPNVFYLVSVSENAISAFERRGLPFRDVFDSSFDTIVHVNFLRLEESKRLLKRRTTKLPEPFLCLCHCLSGGLPRDLIRSCREMLGIAREDKLFDLLPLARRVITHEVRGKARAMSIAASNLRADVNQTQFLSSLTTLLGGELDEQLLLQNATPLLTQADLLREAAANQPLTQQGAPSEEAANLTVLADLEAEFALYLGYVGTVLEVIDRPKGDAVWHTAEQDSALGPNIFDALASTRQALAVSASVGRERLVFFRTTQNLLPAIAVPLPPAPKAAIAAAPNAP